MKWSFAWQPLRPPDGPGSPPWIPLAAVVGGGIMFSGGLGQVLLGWDKGLGLFLPLFASVLLFGLPHGAIDHLVALGLARCHLHLRSLLVVVSVYLLLTLLFLLLWRIAPTLAALAFLCMTIYHWGRADTAFELSSRRNDTPLLDFRLRRTHSALRGLIPIGLPFLAFPGETEVFLGTCAELFGASLPTLSPLYPIIGFALTLLVVLEMGLLRLARSGRRRLALETGLLIVFFLLVPPLLAIGWYFCFWHGLRHILRLCRYRTEDSQSPKNPFPAQLALFYRRGLPLTFASIGLLLVLAWLVPMSGSALEWVALYLVFISALTFPHIILVEWMDRQERS
jgi:beta-carotene 15,15'-dioxygenase